MTDAPPIITNEDAAIDSAFFGSHAPRPRASTQPMSICWQEFANAFAPS